MIYRVLDKYFSWLDVDNQVILSCNYVPLNQGMYQFSIIRCRELILYCVEDIPFSFYNTVTWISKLKELRDKTIFVDLDTYIVLWIQKNNDEYTDPYFQVKDLLWNLSNILRTFQKHWIIIQYSCSDNCMNNYQEIIDTYLSRYQHISDITLLTSVSPKTTSVHQRQHIDLNTLHSIIKSSIILKRYKECVLQSWKDIVNQRLLDEVSEFYNLWYSQYLYNFIKIFNYLNSKKIPYFVKWSWSSSLILFLIWASLINPIKNNLSFKRFLYTWKIADIDIDIPSWYHQILLQELQEIYKEDSLQIIMILNSSSRNINKSTFHPTGILLENANTLNIPLSTDSNWLLYCELYDSSSFPTLEKLGYLKYDIIRSQVLQDLCDTYGNTYIYDVLHNWEDLVYQDSYNELFQTKQIFQLSSPTARKLISQVKPKNFQQLVNIIASNRPAVLTTIPFDSLVQNLKQDSIFIQDRTINSILKSSNAWTLLLYQDQVLDLLQYILPELPYQKIIDLLKSRGWTLSQYKDVFISRLEKKINNRQYCEFLFWLCQNFWSYGFNKGHAYSYWVISLLQLYLFSNNPQR